MKHFFALPQWWLWACMALLAPLGLKADTFFDLNNSSNFSYTYNGCTGAVHFKILVGDISGCDDALMDLIISSPDANGTSQNVFRVVFNNYNLPGRVTAFNTIGSYYHDVTGNGWNGHSIDNVTTTTSVDLIYLEFDWQSPTQSQLDAGTISFAAQFVWDIDWASPSGCSRRRLDGITNFNIPVSTGAPQQVGGLTRTENCGSVLLSWNGIAPTCTSHNINYGIYRDGNLVDTTSGTTYNDVVPSGTYSYTVKSRKNFTTGGRNLGGSPSFSVVGTPKFVPEEPYSLVASDDICANSLLVNWSFTPQYSPIRFRVERSTTNTPFNSTYSTTVSISARQFNDQNIVRGQQYFYRLFAVNSCGDSPVSDVDAGFAPAIPAAPTNIVATPNAVAGVVSVAWLDNANNETGYRIARSFQGGGGLATFNVGPGVTSFTDNSATSCQNYVYQIYAENDCSTNGVVNTGLNGTAVLPTDITDVFNTSNRVLTASKGYYSNRVQLTWLAQKANLLDVFKIYRRQLGTATYVQLTSVNNSQTSYDDLTADANIIYEYKIEGVKNCGNNDVVSNNSTDIGLKSPSGVVTGQISYTGGVGVPDVRVLAQNVNGAQGSSLQFDGNSYLSVPYTPAMQYTNALSAEAWVRPSAISGPQNIFVQENIFDMSADGSDIVVFLYQFGLFGNASLRVPNVLSVGNYTHVGFSFDAGKIKVYVNGVARDSVMAPFSRLRVNTSSANLTIGGAPGVANIPYLFNGNIDDVRLWKVARTGAEVLSDYNRVLSGQENGLFGYWRFDENIAGLDKAFDISKTGNNFNANHGEFVGNVQWSPTIPSSAQLGYAGITNASGAYIISGIRYNGTGENFQVVPNLGVHVFSPVNRTLFVGDGSTSINNIDFLDQSSFRVVGRVKYKDCNCLADSVSVLVDGRPVNLSNGVAAVTDINGEFDIQVPIGLHSVSLYKKGHVFSVGRWPSTGLHDFQEPILTHIPFVDSTLITVVGRVAGGWVQGDTLLGLGRSRNNIGQAGLRFTSPLVCKDTTVQTNAVTGEYTVNLPPMRYEITQVTVVNNPLLAATLLPAAKVVDLRPYRSLTVVKDSVRNALGTLLRVDSVRFHYFQNFIHVEQPKISVLDSTGRVPFVGETTFRASANDNLSLTGLRFPVFRNGNRYRALVQAFEVYVKNPGLPSETRDTIPVKAGEFRMDNRIALNERGVLSFNQYQRGQVSYIFFGGAPNIAVNSTVPDYSFTKTWQMDLVTSNHTVRFEPYSTPTAAGPSADRYYRAYVFGPQHRGTDFTTGGPALVELVLRRPPGDRSYTKWSRNVTIGKRESTYNDNQLDISAKAGVTFGFVAGSTATVGSETHQEVGLYFNSNFTWGKDNTFYDETTAAQDIQTPYEGEGYGDQGDVYLGRSRQIIYGITDDIKLVKASVCDLGAAVCAPVSITIGGVVYQPGKMVGMAVKYDERNVVNFAYTRFHIETNIIPALEMLRNRYFVTQSSKYSTTLTASDPRFGSNNDDPVWGTQASTSTPYQTERNLTGFRASNGRHDYAGPSYTFNNFAVPADSAKVDSIRWYNQQIRLWKIAIRSNEKEKLKAKGNFFGPPSEVLNFGGAVSIGRNYSQTREDEETKTYEFDMDAGVWASLNTGAGLFGASIGLKLDMELGYGHKYASNTTTSTTTQTTFEYHFEDKDLGDALSVSIFPSNNTGWSHLFVTNGGRTSCPHDAGAYSRYTSTVDMFLPDTVCTSHTDYLGTPSSSLMSARTAQREKPTISITPSILYNVPSDQAAVFNVEVSNLSETSELWEYNVFLDESSNPNSCRPLGAFNGVYDVPGGSSTSRQLSILRGPTAFEYDSVRMIVNSTCQWRTEQGVDIADTAYFSIRYLPTCTPPSIVTPLDNWVLNSHFRDTLPVTIAGYDYNYYGLDKIKFQYRNAASPIWTDVETFYKDLNTAPPSTVPPRAIPSNLAYINKLFDFKQIPDGDYQIRAVTECNFPGHPIVEKAGDIADGLADRVKPSPFGTPSPGDGILSPNDDISIQFNEPINGPIIRSDSVVIKAVLNGSQVANDISLSFDGSGDYAMLETGLNLSNRNFTLECWHKRDVLGEQTLFSQGIDPAQMLWLGFDANNKFSLKIGNAAVVSDNPVTDLTSWAHYSVVFDNSTKTTELFVNGVLVNVSAQRLNNTYTGGGRSYFGKASTGAPRWLNGAIHEVRVWNKKRTVSQIISSKSVLLSGTEEGIVGNWRMDEAFGRLANDRVRHRNANIINATWKVFPSGSSIEFNSNSHLTIPSNDLSISEEMDFTLEMWVKGIANGSQQTLWSNGKADGTDGTPQLKWRLDADGTGSIKLYNNALEFNAISTNVLDDNWHHLAFVMKRSSSLSAYLDGQLVSTTPAAPWGEIGGAQMWLGNRGFFVGTAENHDQGFLGKIDEFRLWNTSRQQVQVSRDMVHAMNANEIGLISYLPFEEFVGIPPILTPSIKDIIRPTRIVQNSAAALSPQSPTIKLPRAVQSIPLQLGVNNDLMVLSPNIDPALIENVTLDITVRGIEDMHGNIMQAPATWIAYMDKNQVKWQDQELSFTKEINTQLTFNAVIVNTGGALKQYTIQNLPSWLSVSSPSGVIAPASSLTVTFTVDQGLNIGDYEQDIQLLTDFGYAEVLVVKMKVFAPAPSTWTVNPSAFQSSMSMIGALQVDNVLSSNTEDRLAAFVNGQCRGVGRLQYYPQYDRYLVFLDVYSNVSSGEQLDFQMWDASKGQIYGDVQPHIDFFADSLIGQVLNPQIFNATSKVIVTRTLNNGWNWLSFPAMPTDSVNIDILFQTLTFNNNDEFKSNTMFTRYAPAIGWGGSLSSVDVESSYRLKASNGGVLTYEARELDPSTKPISLAAGWNWMGFVSLRNQAVGDALGNHNPTAGDLIKGQTQFAVYDPTLGWIGSLEYLRPSEGYMMRSAAAGTFTFPLSGRSNRNPSDAEIVDARWPYNPGDWNTNASMVAELDYCGNAVPEGAYYIGVFQGNQCRGLAEPMLFSNRQRSLAFVTLYGTSNDSLELRLLDRVTGAETTISARVAYIPNGQLGDLTTPHTLQLPSGFACQGISGVEDVENSLIGARPVPFADDLTVTWPEELAPASEEVTIRLTDMQGKLITEVRANGGTKFLGQLSQLPNGMYILTVQGDTQTAQLKVVKARP